MMLLWGPSTIWWSRSVPNCHHWCIECARPRRAAQHIRSATPSNATAVAWPTRGTFNWPGRRPAAGGRAASPATSRHLRGRVVELARLEALKDPGARRLPEKVDHVHHSIFDEFMLREGLQRKLLRSPLLLAVTGLLGLLRKLPARTGRLRARLEATRERKLASLLDRLALSDVYWWMLVRRAQFWRNSGATLAQFWRNSGATLRNSVQSRATF